MNRVSLFLLVSALLIVSTLAAPNVVNQDVASGQCYQYINTTVSTWDQAKAAADAASFNGVPGYLVTVTSQAEEDYIFANVISNTSASLVYTAGITNTAGEYVWADGPENGLVIRNSSGSCVQAICFFRAGFPTNAAINSTIEYSLDGWVNGLNTDVAGFIIEYGNSTNPCVPSVSATPSATKSALPSNSAAASKVTTTGLSISPSNFRPTITITSTVSTTSVSRTTGKRTTGSRTTGKRGTTGKVSAASSMTFSAVSVFVAGVTLMFLRR